MDITTRMNHKQPKTSSLWLQDMIRWPKGLPDIAVGPKGSAKVVKSLFIPAG